VCRLTPAMIMTLLRNIASVEAFDRQMAVNARGTMLCYKHAAEQMILQKSGGRIIGTYAPDS
jgi:NAD(P)-dependent dehydrogenase (short-subunit alcohol dehydrogenase family)